MIQQYFISELKKMTSVAIFENKVSSSSLSNPSESQATPFRSPHPQNPPALGRIKVNFSFYRRPGRQLVL